MREMLERRYTNLAHDKGPSPDLVLVDGGKGQLNVAIDVFKILGLNDLPVIGLAKEFEHVFIPQTPSPLILPRDSEALLLLQRIRDEAHRFAINYHKNLRSKEIERSILDEIPGVGKKRKIKLLKQFGDISNVEKASVNDIAMVDGINRKLATIIHLHLHQDTHNNQE
jgi:excinuclease ABC subunit C